MGLIIRKGDDKVKIEKIASNENQSNQGEPEKSSEIISIGESLEGVVATDITEGEPAHFKINDDDSLITSKVFKITADSFDSYLIETAYSNYRITYVAAEQNEKKSSAIQFQ
jgi:hypothetical protein